ncbi:hypothetical protein LSTR_LSTR009470 [Laodelphax striatellus]|uniref:Uncharacterized protein n=1 Tax=Laodelphax striatellus TaxID=195883 RepID=A0A482WGH3_LAOST|nr:hypothetical protein LSTR_LSTR009470 [Laodelphax striatellus]
MRRGPSPLYFGTKDKNSTVGSVGASIDSDLHHVSRRQGGNWWEAPINKGEEEKWCSGRERENEGIDEKVLMKEEGKEEEVEEEEKEEV